MYVETEHDNPGFTPGMDAAVRNKDLENAALKPEDEQSLSSTSASAQTELDHATSQLGGLSILDDGATGTFAKMTDEEKAKARLRNLGLTPSSLLPSSAATIPMDSEVIDGRSQGDINFERDFGQWFSPEPAPMPPHVSLNAAPMFGSGQTANGNGTMGNAIAHESLESRSMGLTDGMALEEFDASMFRPDGDENFVRDFGQWFNPEDLEEQQAPTNPDISLPKTQ